MHYVYLLSSSVKNWVYVGCTDNLKKRFDEHQQKRVSSTKAYAPFDLVYYEAYKHKTDARIRENNLKRHSTQKEFLLKQIKHSLKKLV